MTAPLLAWLCDLDGTLYRPGGMKLLMGAELALGAPHRIGLLRDFRLVHEELRCELRADPTLSFSPSPFEEQVRRCAEKRGCPESLVRELVMDWMVRRPGKWLRRAVRVQLVAELGAFKAAGGQLAVVSDYPAKAKLDAMGLAQLFDVVVSSGEHPGLKRLKPAPDGYLLAAAELGVEPAQCLVLGDRGDADGEAARRAGMSFRLIR